ncbi:assimilatory sulfite reductase (NADPH) flavoprotein subunit [Leucothrix arctica]|uniref:Sulfite reductase [NADPH] flavoprotein alpha-component n=1 Tax=Leucothrix arctica TaxID=1481894 RepID=A0A317CC02_9GAMM|nr:assimilatory sulfite reductase (NADPH) flavoprotein subunit [Leucothrix arctica]PWQ93602.1 assimilatory sulfite reductase (NADPH) flavoprotein subunit [Leucothrix arctica]
MQLLTPQQIEQASAVVNGLSPAQQVWVSGYLHGLSSQQVDIGATGLSVSAAAAPAVAQKVTVLYGSQTGNSRKIAEKLHAALEAQGKDVTLSNMANYRGNSLKKEEYLFTVISTHGNGEPPDEALGFFKFINGAKAPKLDNMKFSVLALGDSSYDEFCQTGVELDTKFAALGATRLNDVILSDVDFAEEAEEWHNAVLSQLEKASGVTSSIALGATPPAAGSTEYTEQNPFQAEIIENIVLTDDGSDKSVLHLELSLEDSGIKYLPGDIVAIQTNNAEDLVSGVISNLGLDPDTSVTIKKGTYTLREALSAKRELTHVTRKQLQAYAELTSNTELLAQAKEKSQLEYELYSADILDVLELWPAKLDAQSLVDWLRPMGPRQYSIASSEEASPEEVHVLVKHVEYHYRGRDHGGVCSSQLAKSETGDMLGVSFKDNASFKLPENGDTKVIMIGAGTGVAPFRSFLFDREAKGIEGNTWLFFGEQRFQTDFLYQTEWQQHLKSGVLEKMTVAFSRDQEQKIYVQTRILEQAEQFYEWLEAGAHIYICGDMHRMAKDVHEALIEVVTKQSGRNADEASEWLDQLVAEKRYQRDVY